MKIVILAAGFGSRLKEGLPKAAVELANNFTILDYQLHFLKKSLNIDFKDIIVVVGYKSELILNKHPELSFAYNHNYINTCNAKSLLIALQEDVDEDVLWMNGDVVFDPQILDIIAENMDHNFCIVDNRHIRETELKYNLNDDETINQVSFHAENPLGELIGINFIKKEFLDDLISNLKKSDDQDYFDIALQLTINEGIPFVIHNIQNNFFVEIDYPEELEEAKRFIKENIKINPEN